MRLPLELVDAWIGRGAQSYPLHRHRCAELVFHRSGSGSVQVEAGALPFAAGSVVHCPSGCAHGEHWDEGTGALVVVQFRWRGRTPPGMERPWATPPLHDPWLAGEFAWLGSDAWRHDEGHRLEAACRAAAAISHLLAGPVSQPMPVHRPSIQRVQEAQRFISAHLDRVSVAAVARAAGSSAGHLNRLFRENLGYGPRRAIALARIDRGKQLLLGGGLPVQAVAEAVGYATARHFCAVFRRLTGMTPGGFRAARADRPRRV